MSNDNMLGLKITRTLSGYSDLYELNSDASWTKHVSDIRHELTEDWTPDIIRFVGIETGHLFTITSLIPGRGRDNISVWIHVPLTIDISNKEFLKEFIDIINVVKAELRSSQFNGETFAQLFSKSYASAPAKRVVSKFTGEKYAFRYYGVGTLYNLSEILQNLDQSSYKNYKAIYLIDKSAANVAPPQGNDMSSGKITSQVMVLPPQPIDGYTPHIAGEPFNTPIYASIGDRLSVEWVRKGYVTIIKSATVQSAGTVFEQPKRNEHKIHYPCSAISVVNEQNQPITNCTIKINNVLVKRGGYIEISEELFSNSQIDISADGYGAQRVTCDLRNRLTITLKRSSLIYRFKLPSTVMPYPTITFEYPSKHHLEECPIEGYQVEDNQLNPNGDNWLEYKPFTRKMKLMLIILPVIAMLIGAGIATGITVAITGSSNEQKGSGNNNIVVPRPRNESTPKPEEASDIADYLDNHDKWNKDDMRRKDQALADFWDLLNKGNLHQILDIYSNYPEFTPSRKFKQLSEIASKIERIHGVAKAEAIFGEGEHFCKNEEDVTITFDKYIKVIEKKVESPHIDNDNSNGGNVRSGNGRSGNVRSGNSRSGNSRSGNGNGGGSNGNGNGGGSNGGSNGGNGGSKTPSQNAVD